MRLGLDVSQGLNLTESFYWDLNDRTRAFTNRVKSKTPNNWPNMIHAGCYSATLHYLKTVADMGAAEAKKDGAATVARMKKMPVEDDCFGKTTIREDGRNLTTAYLFEVKKPSESKGPWDYFKLVATTPGDRGVPPAGRRPLRLHRQGVTVARRHARGTGGMPRMITIFGIPGPLLFGQLLLGLINGAFYAMLSLGLAVIFGMLNIINFAHGALFMMGAFASWMLLQYAGIGYFPSLILAPLIIGVFGVVLERTIISRLYKLDHLYGLLLTFGLALVIQGLFRNYYGSSGLPYRIPDILQGATDLGFMFMPNYRGWVVLAALVVCLATWAIIEKTSLGATLRAATENAPLVQAFGVNVPRVITLTYGGGVALAAFAGVLAAPIYSVNPNMGDNFINTVFAVVVIGGMGSIMGSIVTGFALGVIEGLTKVFYPQASATVVFLVMVIVLLTLPHGLFGRRA